MRLLRLPFPDGLSLVCAVVALAAPWSNGVRPAHLTGVFGFQTAVPWLFVAATAGVVLLDLRAAAVSLAAAGGLIAAWFAWAMWMVTTPAFTSLPFSWVGTDILGAGWYLAAFGYLWSGVALIKRLIDARAPVAGDLWLLTAIPGFGLMRLGDWSAGIVNSVLFTATFYFATTDSQDATLFEEYGKTNNVPPAYPRTAEWVLFALAAGIWVFSVVLTIRRARSERA